VNKLLKITEVTGKKWDVELSPGSPYTIGRAKDNRIVLNDQRVSRYHAHLKSQGDSFAIIDGYLSNGQLRRSVNGVFVNQIRVEEVTLKIGDEIKIGGSTFRFQETSVGEQPVPDRVAYEDQPLGGTQLLMSAREIMERRSSSSLEASVTTPDEINKLRRKSKILALLYEMSETLGSVFDREKILDKTTDLVFRGTPAERVVALLVDGANPKEAGEYALSPISIRVRDPKMKALTEKLAISRTITKKVLREKVAILSQDARDDEQFSGSESIVSQGVRSTICAPLVTESGVHGVIYADRLNPFAEFSSDDLELISAVAAQAAVAIETIKAHDRLAREEVARANYSRFLPDHVVQELLNKPDSFRLGGVNQLITVLFADIRGFTSLSEHRKPEMVVGLLNRYFSAMTEIIFAHSGTLDKFIGDGLMALFGAPKANATDAQNALRAAVAMQERMKILNEELVEDGFDPIEIGIGLHTGVATIGYIGSEKRSEYTAIGDTVNLAARLESSAKRGTILISEATARASNNIYPLISMSPLTVKNRAQPVNLFEVKWS